MTRVGRNACFCGYRVFAKDSRMAADLEECLTGFNWGAAYSQPRENAGCKDSRRVWVVSICPNFTHKHMHAHFHSL